MPADITIYNLESLGAPLGQYSHIARVRAKEHLFIAGMLSADRDGKTVGIGDFDKQTDQVFTNLRAALQSADADFTDVVQFTTYLVHSHYIPKFMDWRLCEFPKMFPSGVYPPNTLLIIDRLVNEEFMIEVQAIAALG